MNISIETPNTADAQALLEVQIRAFHDDARLYPGVELGGPPGYDSIDVLLDDIQASRCYKIVHQGEIIGGIVVFQLGDKHYHLDRLFVDPSWHNHGVGTYAMQFLEEHFPARIWTLDTPLYATRNQYFYGKLGFVKMGEKESDDVPLVSYEKRSKTLD